MKEIHGESKDDERRDGRPSNGIIWLCWRFVIRYVGDMTTESALENL